MHPRQRDSSIWSDCQIAILGHVGNRNLGDEALIASVIEGIRERIPDVRIRAFSARPEDTQARHGVVAFALRRTTRPPPVREARTTDIDDQSARVKHGPTHPDPANPVGLMASIKARIKRRPLVYKVARKVAKCASALRSLLWELPFLFRAFRQLRGVNLMIIAGSQQLIDYIGGPWEHLYTILKWTVLARLRGACVAFVSCGAGPIQSRLGLHFARWALRSAVYRSFRDRTSIELVERLGIPGANLLTPDLAYGMRRPNRNELRAVALAIKVVAINPVPFNDPTYWLGSNETRYRRYVETLAAFAAWLLSKGIKPVFLPTQLNLDPPVIADILAEMHARGLEESVLARCVAAPAVDSLDSLLAEIERADLVVASRFHGVVLSLNVSRPVLGIAYHAKTREAMGQLGLEAFSLDILDLSLEGLIERFERLRIDWPERAPEVMRRLEVHRTTLSTQFDNLAELATRCRASF
jgi:polysaccharide pyruvyl transferase WcaK-like protein